MSDWYQCKQTIFSALCASGEKFPLNKIVTYYRSILCSFQIKYHRVRQIRSQICLTTRQRTQSYGTLAMNTPWMTYVCRQLWTREGACPPLKSLNVFCYSSYIGNVYGFHLPANNWLLLYQYIVPLLYYGRFDQILTI